MICLLINSHHNIILVSASFVLNQFNLVPKHLLNLRNWLRKTILAALRIDVLRPLGSARLVLWKGESEYSTRLWGIKGKGAANFSICV